MKHLALILFCLYLAAPALADDVLVPGPPLSLRASSTDEGVLLEWSAPPTDSQVQGYRVYRSDGVTFAPVHSTPETQYLDESGHSAFTLEDVVTYYVTAFNDVGEGPPSNTAVEGSLVGDYPYCWTLVSEPYPGEDPFPPFVVDDYCWLPLPINLCSDIPWEKIEVRSQC